MTFDVDIYATVMLRLSVKNEVTNSTRSTYWDFLLRFPMHRKPSPIAEAIFLSEMTHGAADRVMNDRKSDFPFTGHECQRLLRIYWDIKGAFLFSLVAAL